MLEQFLIYINKSGWNLAGSRTLLAVSGGIDSVVMADLFSRAGLQAAVAHCNFRLRGDESDQDEIFVHSLAVRYGFPFHVTAFETLDAATEAGISTQMAARELRYGWFKQLSETHGYDFIATAHHRNDHLETILLNICRGTGLKGLLGIRPENGRIIRPLRFSTRDQVRAYAEERKLAWREDSSNSSTYYRRNLIRHEVVPVLKAVNPSLESAVELMTERLTAAGALLTEHLRDWKEQAFREENGVYYIRLDVLAGATVPVYRLHFLLDPYGFSYSQCRDIVDALDETSGKQFFSDTHYLIKDRSELVMRALTERGSGGAAGSPPSFTLDIVPRSIAFRFPDHPKEAWFDADRLRYPLEIRRWEYGDWFCPLGMGGKKKKVSDLLVDLKINLIAKDDVHVLTDSEGAILWVVGLRNDHRARVTEQTTRIARVRID